MRKNMFLILLCFVHLVLNAAPINISTKPVQELAFYPTTDAPAEVISLNDSVVRAQITAQLNQFNTKVGDKVKKGQVICQLDCNEHTLAAERTQAQIKGIAQQIVLYEWKVKRTQSLAQQNHASKEGLLQAQTDLIVATAKHQELETALKLAQQHIRYCAIRAPFDGTITQQYIHTGELATPNTPVFAIVDHRSLELQAFLQPDEIESLSIGKNLQFEAKNHLYPVKLARAIDRLDPHKRTQEVRLVFTHHAPIVGAAGRLQWQQPKAHLPAHLTVQHEQQLGFYQVIDHTAEFVSIKNAQEGQPLLLPSQFTGDIIVDGRYAVTPHAHIYEGEG